MEQKSYDQLNILSMDEQVAVFAANPYVDRIERSTGLDLILKDMIHAGKNFSLYYYFGDGSGPVLIEVDDNEATFITISDEREPIEETVTYMERGAELLAEAENQNSP